MLEETWAAEMLLSRTAALFEMEWRKAKLLPRASSLLVSFILLTSGLLNPTAKK